MAFKNFFDKLKDKSQDLASGAKKLVSGPEEPPPIDDGMSIDIPADRPSGTHAQRQASVGPPPSSGPSRRPPEPVPPTAPPVLPPPDPNKIAGLGHRSDGANAPIMMNDADDTVYRKRSSVVDEIEEQFGRFGPRVSTYILTQLMMPNGMKMLLTKLDLRSRGFEGGDKALIENWIDLNGPDEFSKRVGLRHRDSESSNPLTANLPPDKETNSAPDLRIRPMAKKVGRPSSATPKTDPPPSSNSVPLPPPTSSRPRAAAPVRPPGSPPSAHTPPPGRVETPHPADESVKIVPVSIHQDAERRASMARSPLPGGADSRNMPAAGQHTPSAPPPPAALPPPPPPSMAAHIKPPILPPMPLPKPPDMGRSDETEEAPSRFPATFLQSAIDESSRTSGPPAKPRT